VALSAPFAGRLAALACCRSSVVEHSIGNGEVVSSILPGSTIHADRVIVSKMTAVPTSRMTVDDYLAWAAEHPGRYELLDGRVSAIPPHNLGHAERKGAAYIALLADIRARALPCHVLPSGMTVRVDDATAYEPDAVVYCGAKLAPSAMEVSDPVIVVEVQSPSTRHIDLSAKLADYFRVPSVAHYLIVDPGKPRIVHHARSTGETILTRIVTDGSITLDPPGIELALDAIYSG
jgi:Uma2 family endonuclease